MEIATATTLLVTALTALILVGTALVVPMIVIYAFYLIRKKVRMNGEAVIDARFQGEPVILRDPAANCYGRQNLGAFQLRGNGALGVSASAIFFGGYMNGTVINIPMQDLRSVELVSSHLGKASFWRKLLKLHYSLQPDSVAFAVPDPAHWKRVIEKVHLG